MFSTFEIFLGDYCLRFYLYTASIRAGASKGMGEEKEAEITKALLLAKSNMVVVVVEDVVTTKALLTRTRAIKWRDMGDEVNLRKGGNSIFTDLSSPVSRSE